MKKWLPEEPKLYFAASGVQIKSLDDVPDVARIAAYQRSVLKWYKIIAILPFAVTLFVVLKFFPNATGRAWDLLIGITLLWAIGFAGYAFKLLFWGATCPACGERFGQTGDKCRSCELPRHKTTPSLLDLQDKIRLLEKE